MVFWGEGRQGEGGYSKIKENEETSFMHDPFEFLPNKLINFFGKYKPSLVIPHLFVHDIKTNSNDGTSPICDIHG